MGAKPTWVGYVGVDDVDATADADHAPWRSRACPADGRFRHQPLFSLHRSADRKARAVQVAQARPAAARRPDAPGRVGWHELLAADWEQAWAFYGDLFGWQKADAEIGETGTYQPFSAGGQMIGGMFTKHRTIPAPFWLYYFNVGDIDATAQRVKAGGGQILEGPIEVAGRQLDRPMRGPAGRGIRAGGNAERPPGRIFRARRIARFFRRARPEMVLVEAEPPGQPEAARLRAATKRKLTDRALDVEFDPGHLREQIDIGASDRTAAEPHVGCHQVERLDQYADVLQDERIGERAVFP